MKHNDKLFATLYAELRRLAERQLYAHRQPSVSPTTLVHEVYLNFSHRQGVSLDDRDQFLAYAGRAMRRVLIDFARRRHALKRGAEFHVTELTPEIGDEVADPDELIQLSDALDALAAIDPRLAEVVDLKYFCGFSLTEISNIRGDSLRTVQRDWEKARLILFREIG